MKGFRSKASSPDRLFRVATEVVSRSLRHSLQGGGNFEWIAPLNFLSPGACLREAASAKAGEREKVRGGFMLGLNHEKIKKERLWEAWSRNDGRR